MTRVLICAAVPRELKYIYRNLSCSKGQSWTSCTVFSTHAGPTQVILLRTGIGVLNAESSIRSLLKDLRPDLIMSLGFGGALYEGAAAGDLIWGSRLLYLSDTSSEGAAEISDISLPKDENIVEKLAGMTPFREGCLVTVERSMRKHEILKSLPDGISFPVCDMEAFVLARTAMERHIPFFAARSISDMSDQEIPREFFGINDESGKIVYSRFLKSVFHKPTLVKDIVWLGINSEKAARSLGNFVKSFLIATV